MFVSVLDELGVASFWVCSEFMETFRFLSSNFDFNTPNSSSVDNCSAIEIASCFKVSSSYKDKSGSASILLVRSEIVETFDGSFVVFEENISVRELDLYFTLYQMNR